MRKCDLSGLPKVKRKVKGEEREFIQWKETVGYTIPFVYDGIEGEVKVLNYTPNTQKLTLLYKDKEFLVGTESVLSCGFSLIVGKFAKGFSYEVGEEINKNGRAIVIEKFNSDKDGKKYKLKCIDCEQTFARSERKIRNSDWGVKCSVCSDGISYPNKFMTSVLTQLKCEFQTEYKIPNTVNKRYDFYIPSLNTLIEVHGRQHYERGFERIGKGARTLEEEQENDILKKKNAIAHGYKYIEINALESETEWIRNSIENSAMKELLELDTIDWSKCHDFATSNITKRICSMFVEDDPSISRKIGEELGLSYNTVTRHLKIGAEFGWCNYDPITIQKLNGASKGKVRAKEIVCVETGQEFESATECARVSLEVFGVQLSQSKISAVCYGMTKSHKGFTFKYRDNEEIDLSQFLKNETAQSICLAKQEDINLSTRKLARMFNVSRDSVVDYLKKGHILGLCHYDKDEEYRRENAKKNTNLKCKQVETFKDGVSQGIFESVRYLSDNSEEIFGVKFAQCSIREVCLGRKKTHRGFTFKYVEEGGEEKCQVV